MAAGINGVVGEKFDPDFPTMNSSTAPRTHRWYRSNLVNTAVDDSELDFAALEAEAPTLLVFLDLSHLDARECEESLASLVVVLHELHPRALLVMSKADAKVAAAAHCPREKSLCDAIVTLGDGSLRSSQEDMRGGDGEMCSAGPDDAWMDCLSTTAMCVQSLDEADQMGCNGHPNGLSHSLAAHNILQNLRNHPRFLREPLLAAEDFSAAGSLLARDRSPVLSGDLLGRWRYLPRGGHPIPAFGTPLTSETEGYCDSATELSQAALNCWTESSIKAALPTSK